MDEVNLSYFMIGTIIFLSIIIVNNILDWKNPPSRGAWMVVDLCFGAIFLLVSINGLMIHNIIKILPLIFIIFTTFLLISRAFIEPNKNFLIIICICACLYFGLFYLLYIIFSAPEITYEFNYGAMAAVAISLGISLTVGIILSSKLKKKWPERQNPIWHINKFWEIINNKTLIAIIITLIMIESLFQLRGQSLLSIFVRI